MGWHTLRLRTRILLGYGLILALTALLALLLIARAATLNQRITQLNDAVSRETTLGVQLDRQVASTQQAIDRYLLQPVPQNLNTANASLQQLADTLATAQTATSSSAQQRRLTALSAQFDTYRRGFQELTILLTTQAQIYGDTNLTLVDATNALDSAIMRYIGSGASHALVLQDLARVGHRVRLVNILTGRMAAEQAENYGQQASGELALAASTLSALNPAIDSRADDPASATAQLTHLQGLIGEYAANIPRIRQQRETLLNEQGTALKTQAGEISRVALDRLAGATTELEQESRQTQQLTLGALALTLGLTVLFGVQLARTITQPVVELAAATSRLVAGDYSTAVSIRDRGELGQLAAAFNYMTRTLAEQRAALVAQQQALAEQNRQLEQALIQLREAKEQAETANRAKSAFLAQMSHELRTPLNGILGYTQILTRKRLDDETINGLSIIKQSGEHLLTLINDILDLARIEAGRLELNPTAVHLPRFLDGIVRITRARAEAKQLNLAFEAPPSLPEWVQADETRLRQILLNLLGNAIKFTDRGQVTLRVSSVREARDLGLEAGEAVQTSSHKPHASRLIRFEVEDTGVGIAPDQLERIFQPFEQVGELTRKVEGSGLGLAISRQLVQFMGGDLCVASEEGRGSSFWFEVPLPLEEAALPAVRSHKHTITGYTGRRRTVLAVDDIPSNRAVLIDMLQPLGFTVLEAADGRQAVELAQQTRPDLILIDWRMPVLNGPEAVQQIRKLPDVRRIPIIVTSASVAGADRAASLAVGADAFVPKPIHQDELLEQVGRLVQLDWVYAQPSAETGGAAVAQIGPPTEEVQRLYDLARRGQIIEIRARIEELEGRGPEYRAFVAELRSLARGYRMREIRAMLEQYLQLGRVYAAEPTAAESPAALVPPPSEELAVLYELAANGDILALQERAAQLEQRDPLWRPFAHKLKHLASRFEMERLQVLLSEYLPAES